MASDTLRHRRDSSVTIEEFVVATLRAVSITPSFELKESAGGKLGRVHLQADGTLKLQTNDGIGGGWIDLPLGTGDVVGPASSTDNAMARFDTTTGRLIQDSSVIVPDSSNGTFQFDGSAVGSAYQFQVTTNDTASYIGTNSNGRPLIVRHNGVDVTTFSKTAVTAHVGITFEGSVAIEGRLPIGDSVNLDTTNNFVHVVSSASTSDDAGLLVTNDAISNLEGAAIAHRGSQWNGLYGKQGSGGAALYTEGEVNLMAGKVGINEKVPDDKLHITVGSSDAVECLKLEQLDVSEGFVNFVATAAANTTNPVSSLTGGNSIQGFLRVEVNSVDRWVPFYDAPTT